MSSGARHLYQSSVAGLTFCANFLCRLCLLIPYLLLEDFCLSLGLTNLQKNPFWIEVKHCAPILDLSCIQMHADIIIFHRNFVSVSAIVAPIAMILEMLRMFFTTCGTYKKFSNLDFYTP